MKVPKWSLMHILGAIYYLHHAGASFIAKRLHEENIRAPPITGMWNVNLEAALKELKGTVNNFFIVST